MPFLFELDDQEKKKSAPTATAKRDPEVDEPLLFDIDPDEEGPPSGVDAAEFWASQYRKVKYLAARQAYLEKKGELIEREEVKDLLVSRMTEIRRGLEQIEQRLPPRLVNQEPAPQTLARGDRGDPPPGDPHGVRVGRQVPGAGRKGGQRGRPLVQ